MSPSFATNNDRLRTIPSMLRVSPAVENRKVSNTVRSGRIYFFAMGFSREWSDLPLTNSFLPLLHELSVAAVPQDFGHRHLACGDKYVLADGTEADTSKPALFMDSAIQCDISVPLRESMTETMQ